MSAMESSSVVAFRAFVMIACLVVVPLAAVVGSAFPDLVKSVLVDRFVASTSQPASTTAAAAPPYGQAPGPAAFPQAELAVVADSAPAWPAHAASQPDSNYPGNIAKPAAANVAIPASFAAPDTSADAAWETRQLPGPAAATTAAGAQDNRDVERRSAPPYQPTMRSAPAQSATRSGTAQHVTPDGPTPSTSPERFTALTRRLREYGATYYRLETWGNQDELFRFHCEIVAGNNPAAGRRFEAADSDPLLAISRVVEQVESWRAGR